jgi:hypothetical protein
MSAIILAHLGPFKTILGSHPPTNIHRSETNFGPASFGPQLLLVASILVALLLLLNIIACD